MPNLKSAKKRMRLAERQREGNVVVNSRVRRARKKLMEAVASGNKDESDKLCRQYCSVLDKAVKRGVIKKNAAVRRKSRAANKVSALK